MDEVNEDFIGCDCCCNFYIFILLSGMVSYELSEKVL